MKRTHLSTRRMIFKYFNCVLHNYIKHIHNCNHLLSYFKLQIHYNIYNDKHKYLTVMWARGNYCGLLDLIITPGYWI